MLDSIAEQVQSAPEEGSGKPCPECQCNTILVHLQDIEIDYCKHCRGCWFDPGELHFIIGLERDIPAEHMGDRASRYHCPVCGEEMHEQVFLQPYNLLVDRCPAGHGVYLEQGELERVFELC